MTNKEVTLEAMREQGRQQAAQFRADAVEQDFDGTTVIENEHLVPEWKQGKYETVGVPVKQGDQVYKVWQAHDSTENPGWTPELAVSLFDIYHTKDPKKAKPYRPVEGARGLYQTDECMIWTDGLVYRSAVDNNDRTPEEVPDNWELQEDSV